MQYLNSDVNYRWLRRYYPENAAALMQQLADFELLSEVLRRAEAWRLEMQVWAATDAF